MPCHLQALWTRAAARAAAPAPTPPAPQDDELNAIDLLDRESGWPTHRIRWYLQTQVRSTGARN